MTLKRSFSQKVKNTIAKTKRIVSDSFNNSPSNSNASTLATSLPNPDYYVSSSSTTLLDSVLLNPHCAQLNLSNSSNNIGDNDISSTNSDFKNINSNANISTPTTIQRSVSSILKSHSSNQVDDKPPTLLYTSRRRSASIRRNKSLRNHPLDFIDTTLHSSQQITSIPSPISIENKSADDTYSFEMSEQGNNYTNKIINNDNNNDNNNEIILLPSDPIDKSIPPCTTEQLTPITPITQNDLNDLVSYIDYNNTSNTTTPNLERPSFLHRSNNFINMNSSSSTITATTNSVSLVDPNIKASPSTVNSSFSQQQQHPQQQQQEEEQQQQQQQQQQQMLLRYKPLILKEIQLLSTKEIIQSNNVNPIFTKSNQIDHFDKALDARKNDLLADQMALNILQNISNENVDELSKLKEEITMDF